MKKITAIFLMANISKGFGVGDTVHVWFKDSNTLRFLPQSRVVSHVSVIDANNVATVTFTNGESVQDGSTTAQRVFTTQALCAAAIINSVITDYTACVLLDTTTSGASTSGQVSTTLVRKS